jgi:hypothetical protein
MNGDRVLETIHGHLGVLAAASLYHPAILMRRGQQLSRGARWAVGLATGFAVAAFSMGLVIYEDYRSVVKRELFEIRYGAGLLFETKEHLAYAVVTMALGAGAAAFLAPPEARRLRQASAAMYLSAALLATGVCALGTVVAAVHSFPE